MHARDDGPLALAGIWEEPKEEGDRPRALIITTDANAALQSIHNRMPAILPPSAWTKWLDAESSTVDLSALLSPSPDDAIEAYPVSNRVNTARFDDPSCIVPVADGAA